MYCVTSTAGSTADFGPLDQRGLFGRLRTRVGCGRGRPVAWSNQGSDGRRGVVMWGFGYGMDTWKGLAHSMFPEAVESGCQRCGSDAFMPNDGVGAPIWCDRSRKEQISYQIYDQFKSASAIPMKINDTRVKESIGTVHARMIFCHWCCGPSCLASMAQNHSCVHRP